MLTEIRRRALEYVRNTNGGATLENFLEDHEPIGRMLWHEISSFVETDWRTRRIHLTSKGEELLDAS